MPTIAASAKINLALHVTGRRDDGYHLIETLAVFTKLSDRLSAQPADTDDFVIIGPEGADLVIDAADSNLVTRARDTLREVARAAGYQAAPLRMELDKRLPVAAGIGGGSADAAAALKLLAQIWGFEPDQTALNAMALKLGADVPMCLQSRPLIAKGIGEILMPVDLGFTLDLVIVNPRIGVATPAVFSALEDRNNAPLAAPEGLSDQAAFVTWLAETRNDLEKPACAMVATIPQCLDALEHTGAMFARMSGSGASCFAIYNNSRDAKEATASIKRAHPGWFVAATRTLPPAE